jgi:DNA polymerase I-like protein with 3'-5' exonuclease and polymerase domains
VYGKLLKEVQEKKLEKLYEKLISPLSVVFRDIEYEGMLIDENKLQELKVQLGDMIVENRETLLKSDRVPPGMNLSSNEQLCLLLFSLQKDAEGEWVINDEYGFGLYPFEYTNKGQPSTNMETLTKIKSMVEEEYVKRGLSGKEGQ